MWGGLPRLLAPHPPLTSPDRFTEMIFKGLIDRKRLWKSLDEMKRMFNFRKTPASGKEHGLELLTSSLRHPLS